MATERTILLNTAEGLTYLQALVDQAPRLSSRADCPDPLTDWWKDAITKIIITAKEGLTASPPSHSPPADPTTTFVPEVAG